MRSKEHETANCNRSLPEREGGGRVRGVWKRFVRFFFSRFDRYIIAKFLGTYFFSTILII